MNPTDGIAFIRDTVHQINTTTPSDDLTLAQLAQTLAHQTVYDASLTLTLDNHTSAAAERLWTLLTRATPRPHVARPATLLATSTSSKATAHSPVSPWT